MRNLLLLLFVFGATLFTSCGDDDKSCDLMEFTIAADANLEIGTTYVDDPTMANCDAYATDLQSIIDTYGDCEETVITAQVAAFQTALDALDCQ